MINANIVKNNKFSKKNVISFLIFLKFQNKLEEEINEINTKIEKLVNKIDKLHIENIHSDEIILQHCRNRSKQN
ncbi:hypothetical protein RJD24_19435 [Bacillaceae bacterium IKA-2]|nr:hypothetical protein RJD24_19435 [Bacillaceae bacterium IKA-2]